MGKRVFILGGGAALGAHQVGAMKYLAEQGITPDIDAVRMRFMQHVRFDEQVLIDEVGGKSLICRDAADLPHPGPDPHRARQAAGQSPSKRCGPAPLRRSRL